MKFLGDDSFSKNILSLNNKCQIVETSRIMNQKLHLPFSIEQVRAGPETRLIKIMLGAEFMTVITSILGGLLLWPAQMLNIVINLQIWVARLHYCEYIGMGQRLWKLKKK